MSAPTPPPDRSALAVNPTTGAIASPIARSAFVEANTLVGTTDTQTLTNKDLSSATNTYRDATTAAAGAVTIDIPGGVPRLGDAASALAAQRIVWDNPQFPIQLTTGADAAQNLWPHSRGFYDHFRDQLVIGYGSGSIRNEWGAGVACYDKYTVVRIAKNVTAQLKAQNTITTDRVVLHASIGSGGTSRSQASNVLHMVQSGLYAGRYVSLISQLRFAAEPTPFTENNDILYDYSDDGGATWTSASMLDSSGNVITGSFVFGIHASADGSLYAFVTSGMSATVWQSFNYTLYRSVNGGNSWLAVDSRTWSSTISVLGALAAPGDGMPSPIEHSIVEYAPGQMLALVRGAADPGPTKLVWCLISDYGRVVSEYAPTNLATNAQPASITYDPATQMLECVYAVRGEPSAGGLYASSTTLAAALRGVWGTPTLIRRPYYTTLAKTALAFYPELITYGERAWLVYYDENTAGDGTTEIYCLTGTSVAKLNQRAVPTSSQFGIFSSDLDLTQIIPGSVDAWDMRNSANPGVYASGYYVRDSRNGSLLRMYAGTDQNFAYNSSLGAIAVPGNSALQHLRTFPANWQPPRTQAGQGIGLIAVVNIKTQAVSGQNRRILSFVDSTNSAQICSIRLSSSNALVANGRSGIGGTLVEQAAPSWSVGKQLVGLWIDFSTSAMTLYANGTTYGPTTVGSGTEFGNTRFYVAGVSSYFTEIAATMDLYFAGAWRHKAGFDAARAELQTKFSVS